MSEDFDYIVYPRDIGHAWAYLYKIIKEVELCGVFAKNKLTLPLFTKLEETEVVANLKLILEKNEMPSKISTVEKKYIDRMTRCFSEEVLGFLYDKQIKSDSKILYWS